MTKIDTKFLKSQKNKIKKAQDSLDKEKNAVWPFLTNLVEKYYKVFSLARSIEYYNFKVDLDEDTSDFFDEDLPEYYESIEDYSITKDYIAVTLTSIDDEYQQYQTEIHIPINYASENGIKELEKIQEDRNKEQDDHKDKLADQKKQLNLEKKKKQFEKLKKELGC